MVFLIGQKSSERPQNFYQNNYNVKNWNLIDVPSNWQMKGMVFQFIQILNIPLAFYDEPNPPHIPDEYNPVGSYKEPLIFQKVG